MVIDLSFFWQHNIKVDVLPEMVTGYKNFVTVEVKRDSKESLTESLESLKKVWIRHGV